jgi:poly(3-hydroxyalkanoate) synthetase
MGSKNKTFILSESGHIAGIVNPPSKKKYGHYTNEEVSGAPEDWQTGAEFQRRVVVAALGGVAGESVGQAGSGARSR